MLQRTRDGYFCLNPDRRPISSAQWFTLALELPAPSVNPAVEELDDHYLCRRAHRGAVEEALSIYSRDSTIEIELTVGGEVKLRRAWDEAGRLSEVHRLDARGDGFSLTWDRGQVVSYVWYRDGRKDGVSREYYRHKPSQLREEINWRRGSRHGICRRFDEDGKLLEQTMYEDGFVVPVLRYRGPPATQPIAQLYRNEGGVFYRALGPIESELKVGMTEQQVQERLKLDFSPAGGIHFPFYTRDLYLHIAFADGRISSIRMGRAGVCYDLKRKR